MSLKSGCICINAQNLPTGIIFQTVLSDLSLWFSYLTIHSPVNSVLLRGTAPPPQFLPPPAGLQGAGLKGLKPSHASSLSSSYMGSEASQNTQLSSPALALLTKWPLSTPLNLYLSFPLCHIKEVKPHDVLKPYSSLTRHNPMKSKQIRLGSEEETLSGKKNSLLTETRKFHKANTKLKTKNIYDIYIKYTYV